MSFSNLLLQYSANLRDSLLANSANEVSGVLKLGGVVALSLVTSVVYTALNAVEVGLRLLASAIALVAFPIFLIVMYFYNMCSEDICTIIPAMAAIFTLGGVVQGVYQFSAGFFTALEMLINTAPQMRPASEIVDTATCNIPNHLFNYIASLT